MRYHRRRDVYVSPLYQFRGGFPIPLIVSFVGLVDFWRVFLLHGYPTKVEKIARIAIYTVLGMLATHTFVIGIGAQRMLLTRTAAPLFDGLEWWILTVSGEVNWIAVLMLFVSIPLMTERKKIGWWLALIAGLAIMAINIPTQIIRTKTLDYLIGALLAAGLVALLFVFKKRLIDEAQKDPRE